MDGSPVLLLLNMAAAAALLIWSVRMVSTGFERALGDQLRRRLRRSSANRLYSAATGAGAAILMQSSAAVAMLLAGFMSTGVIGSVAGLAMILGADLGTAVVVQLLSSRIPFITPLLLLLGVALFLRSSRRIGRIMIGIGLIFLSLDMIRSASEPLSSSGGVQTVMLYLSEDAFSSFAIAAVFAWLIHSSVAAVLLFAILAQQGLLPFGAACSLVLGANLGSSIIPIFLTMGARLSIRRVMWTNLALRGGGAALALVLLALLGPPDAFPGSSAAQQTLNFHLLFNFALLVICLPFVSNFMRLARRLLPDPVDASSRNAVRSALDLSLQNQPSRAFACAQRELVTMGNRIESMLREAIVLFEEFDEGVSKRLSSDMKGIARRSLELRVYLSGIRSSDPDEDTGMRAFDLSGIGGNLEEAADVVVHKMVELARRKNAGKLNFSKEGWRELSDFHDRVLRNVQNGITVLMAEDIGLARDLLEEKEKVSALEHMLERTHLKRLRQGVADSIETSALHLELIHALRTINTSFAMIAHPLVERHGEPLENRLPGI